MPQRLGEYRHRTIIQKRTETRDVAGEPIPSWSQFAIRWAKRRTLSGVESFNGDNRSSEITAEFRTHFTRGINPKMRILYPGEVTTVATTVVGPADTSLTVASADGFPLEGNYRIRIASELMDVTAGNGTTSWTVTRGADGTTAATAYAAGTSVQHMQPYDIATADTDWIRGTETVMQGRLSDGGS